MARTTESVDEVFGPDVAGYVRGPVILKSPAEGPAPSTKPYNQADYASAVCVDAVPAEEGGGVTLYFVVEGRPTVLYLPKHVAASLVSQIALKL